MNSAVQGLQGFSSLGFTRALGKASPLSGAETALLAAAGKGIHPATFALAHMAAFADVMAERLGGDRSRFYHDAILATLEPRRAEFAGHHISRRLAPGFGFYDYVHDLASVSGGSRSSGFGNFGWNDPGRGSNRKCSDWDIACWIRKGGELVAEALHFEKLYENVAAKLRAIDITNPNIVAGRLAALLPFPINAFVRLVPAGYNCFVSGGGSAQQKIECFWKALLQFVKDWFNLDLFGIAISALTGNIPAALIGLARLVANGLLSILDQMGIAASIMAYVKPAVGALLESTDVIRLVMAKGVDTFRDQSIYSLVGGTIAGLAQGAQTMVYKVGTALHLNADIVAAIARADTSAVWKLVREKYLYAITGVQALIDGAKAQVIATAQAAGQQLTDAVATARARSQVASQVDVDDYEANLQAKGEALGAVSYLLRGIGSLLVWFGKVLEKIPRLGPVNIGALGSDLRNGARTVVKAADAVDRISRPLSQGLALATMTPAGREQLIRGEVSQGIAEGQARAEQVLRTAEQAASPGVDFFKPGAQGLVGKRDGELTASQQALVQSAPSSQLAPVESGGPSPEELAAIQRRNALLELQPLLEHFCNSPAGKVTCHKEGDLWALPGGYDVGGVQGQVDAAASACSPERKAWGPTQCRAWGYPYSQADVALLCASTHDADPMCADPFVGQETWGPGIVLAVRRSGAWALICRSGASESVLMEGGPADAVPQPVGGLDAGSSGTFDPRWLGSTCDGPEMREVFVRHVAVTDSATYDRDPIVDAIAWSSFSYVFVRRSGAWEIACTDDGRHRKTVAYGQPGTEVPLAPAGIDVCSDIRKGARDIELLMRGEVPGAQPAEGPLNLALLGAGAGLAAAGPAGAAAGALLAASYWYLKKARTE